MPGCRRNSPTDDRADGLPVWKMLQDSVAHSGHFIPREDIVVEDRGDIEIAQLQFQDIHPAHDRLAIFCSCLVRGSGFHALLSFACWPEHAERLAPVWTRAIDSFKLSIPLPNPT